MEKAIKIGKAEQIEIPNDLSIFEEEEEVQNAAQVFQNTPNEFGSSQAEQREAGGGHVRSGALQQFSHHPFTLYKLYNPP